VRSELLSPLDAHDIHAFGVKAKHAAEFVADAFLTVTLHKV
jgi:hypothetical protein